MSREKKVSDEQLRKEIEQGKTFKQIAYSHGYGYPSETLSARVKELGYESNRLAKIRKDGGVNIYVRPDDLEEALDKSGVKPVEKDGSDALSYSVVRVSNDGCIILKPHGSKWRKID